MTNNRWLSACFLFISCTQPEPATVRRYFDLEGYFEQEIIRLEKQNSNVIKTVSRNGLAEKKDNISPNWITELSLFVESDINKPAWSDSYMIRSGKSSTTYTALESKLRTRSMLIRRNKGGNIKQIVLFNSTKNYLYSASEELHYIPDSLYSIKKKQDVILLGSNSYEISGSFK